MLQSNSDVEGSNLSLLHESYKKIEAQNRQLRSEIDKLKKDIRYNTLNTSATNFLQIIKKLHEDSKNERKILEQNHANKFKSLQDDLINHEQTIQKDFQPKIEQLDRQNKNLSKKLIEMQTQLNKQKENNLKVTKQTQDLKFQLQKTKKYLNQKTIEYSKLQKQIQTKNNQYSSLKAKHENLSTEADQLKNSKAEVQRLNLEASLQKKNDKSKLEWITRIQGLNISVTEIENLSKDEIESTIQTYIQDLKNKVRHFTSLNEKVIKSLSYLVRFESNDVEQLCKNIKSQIDQYQRQKVEYSRQKNEMETKFTNLSVEQGQSLMNIKNLTNQVNMLKSGREQDKKILELKQKQITQLKDQINKTLRNKQDEIKGLKSRYEGQGNKLKSFIQQISKQKLDLDNKLKEEQSNLVKLKKKAQEADEIAKTRQIKLNTNLQAQKKKVESSSNELKAQKKKVESMDKKVRQLQQEKQRKVESMNKTIRQLQQEKQNLTKKQTRLSQEHKKVIQLKDQTIKGLLEEKKDLQIKIKQFSGQLQKLKKKVEQLSRNINQKDQMNKLLISQNNKLQQQKKQKQQKIKKFSSNQKYLNKQLILPLSKILLKSQTKLQFEETQRQIDQFMDELNASLNKIRFFSDSQIVSEQPKQHEFLISSLESSKKMKILKTQKIYKYEKQLLKNYHHYIDKVQNLLVIIKGQNKKTFGAFTYDSFDPDRKDKQFKGNGFMFSLDLNEVFPIKQKPIKPVIEYEKNHIIFGNSDIKVKVNEGKAADGTVFSNFGITYATFQSKKNPKTSKEQLLGSKESEIRFSSMEIYRVIFNGQK